jgi:hypothetical protein
VGSAISKSTYLFPSIEVVHLIGLTLLLGAILVVDMRLLGVGMQRQKISDVARSIEPLFWIGVGLAILTGTILFVSEAVKCYFNESFKYKMILLVLALAFHVTLHRRVRLSDNSSAIAARAAAVASLSLWFGVGIAGRWIGFI